MKENKDESNCLLGNMALISHLGNMSAGLTQMMVQLRELNMKMNFGDSTSDDYLR